MPIRFVDARGIEWEVWEVAARVLADAPATTFASGIGGYGSWLCFESATQRRRLARYPARWEAMLPHELEALCLAARALRPVFESGASARATSAW